MLAPVTSLHADFASLCNYLLRGKPGTKPNPTRVAWTTAYNLHTNVPRHAAKIMDATCVKDINQFFDPAQFLNQKISPVKPKNTKNDQALRKLHRQR